MCIISTNIVVVLNSLNNSLPQYINKKAKKTLFYVIHNYVVLQYIFLFNLITAWL